MFKIYPESSRQLIGSKAIYEYIHGGRGIVKLEAPSGKSHSYIFIKPTDDSFPDDVLFVYARHDDKKQFYVGMVERDKFRLTKHSRFLPDTEIVRGAYYIMRMALDNELAMTTPMKLYHMGMCGVCGRQLTQSKSLKTGIGPKCRKKRYGDGTAKSTTSIQ